MGTFGSPKAQEQPGRCPHQLFHFVLLAEMYAVASAESSAARRKRSLRSETRVRSAIGAPGKEVAPRKLTRRGPESQVVSSKLYHGSVWLVRAAPDPRWSPSSSGRGATRHKKKESRLAAALQR